MSFEGQIRLEVNKLLNNSCLIYQPSSSDDPAQELTKGQSDFKYLAYCVNMFVLIC